MVAYIDIKLDPAAITTLSLVGRLSEADVNFESSPVWITFCLVNKFITSLIGSFYVGSFPTELGYIELWVEIPTT